MQISKLQPIGRKLWVSKKWQEYEIDRNTLSIKRASRMYKEPTNELFRDRLDRSKWKSTIDRKVNYLLARSPIVEEHQAILDELLEFIRETAREYLIRGSLIWIVQGDGEAAEPRPLIMNDTIAIYADEYREDTVAYIRRFAELEIDELTGAETELVYFECYYKNGEVWQRDTFSNEFPERDRTEALSGSAKFIELGSTGDAPLFAYVEGLLGAFDRLLIHQDKTVDKNTNPLVEVKGYSGTDDGDLKYAVEKLSLVKVDGTGGVTVHSRNMDSAAIDLWARRLMTEYYEATATVGKENELSYAQSGKAMDRLFIDMENSARELAEVLEKALVEYFEVLGHSDVDITWNTDRPIDDVAIISGIQGSAGLLSEHTLLEQHPWVDDVEEELRRKQAEIATGMDDLVDEEIPEDQEWEVEM